MTRCLPASGHKSRVSRTRGWTPSRRSWLRMAALVFFSGVLSAAATVAAARAPDPQVAYGPPPTPESFRSTQIEPSVTAGVTPVAVAEVFATPIAAEAKVAPTVEAATEMPAAEVPEAEAALEATIVDTTSSTTESPTLVASSWSMEPLPEEPPAAEGIDAPRSSEAVVEANVAVSGTDQLPETQSSSVVAAPQ